MTSRSSADDMKPWTLWRILVWGGLTVAFIGACIGVVFLLEGWERRSDLAGPASLSTVTGVTLANGRPAILVTAKVRVDTNTETYDQYKLILVEPATGTIAMQRWWEEKHDHPRCIRAAPGSITCTSHKTSHHARDLATLARMGATAEAVPDVHRRCTKSNQTRVGDTMFSQERVAGTRRERVVIRQGGAEPRRCEIELIESSFLCDSDRDATLVVPGVRTTVVVSDAGSTIAQRQTLTHLAIDDECNVVWRDSRPDGSVAFSTVVQNLLILAITPAVWTDRAALLALDATSGRVMWQLDL